MYEQCSVSCISVTLTLTAEIPDSKAVYEAKKRRERMRREGNDGFVEFSPRLCRDGF